VNKVLITLRKRAQSTVEYAMIFAIAIGAIALAQTLIKRSLAGKLVKGVDVYLNNGDAIGGTYFEKDTEAGIPTYRGGKSKSYAGQKGGLEDTDDGQAILTGTSNEGKRISAAGDLGEGALDFIFEIDIANKYDNLDNNVDGLEDNNVLKFKEDFTKPEVPKE
jgi:hypothetical protein